MLNQIRCPYCMETIDLSNEPIYCENCGKDISEVYHHLMPNAVKPSSLPSAAYHGGKSRGTRKPCTYHEQIVNSPKGSKGGSGRLFGESQTNRMNGSKESEPLEMKQSKNNNNKEHLIMGSNYAHKVTYSLDVVFCIDSTMSMQYMIGEVTQNALHFYDDLARKMEEMGKCVDKVRVRIISFRDYNHDMDRSMESTRFFELPEEKEKFERAMKSITVFGGGDDAESSLEALAYAIRSDWRATTDRYRQVIVLWTDDEPHPLNDRSYQRNIYSSLPNNDPARYYPSRELPRDLSELCDWWEDPDLGYIDQTGKRLLLFSPLQVEGTSGPKASYAWGEIRDWSNVIHRNVSSTGNLQELDYDVVVETVSKSV